MRFPIDQAAPRITLGSAWFALLILIALLIAASAPAWAHTDHKKKMEAAAKLVPPVPQTGAPAAAITDPKPSKLNETMEAGAEERPMMSFERLLDWLGRLHPSTVHFPLAFIPAALFTAIVGRRRPGFDKPVQFLVVAGGITAPLAMIVGWLGAGWVLTDVDPLMRFHRWLGTGIGVLAFGLAIWAWKRPESDRSNGMLVGLTILTAALFVQGWFGGAMIHGVDHLNW